MKWLVNIYRFGMKSHNRILFLLDSSYKLIFLLLFLPLFHLALDYIMKLWGQSYITVGNLSSFLTYGPVIILLILSMIILSIYNSLKLTTLISYTLNNKPNPSILAHLAASFSLIKQLFHREKGIILIYNTLLSLFLNLPTLIGFTIYLKLPLLRWRGASDHIFIKGLIILALIFFGFIYLQNSFALHSCIDDRRGLRYGFQRSRELLQARGLKTAFILLLYNLALYLFFYIIYRLILTTSALLVYLFTEKHMVITVFLSIYPKINLFTLVLFGTGAYLINLNIISTLYKTYLRRDNIEIPPSEAPKDLSPSLYVYRPITICIFVFIIAFGLFSFYYTIKNNSFHLQEALSGIQITAHRGNSLMAPENTLPALEQAIEAHADAAEIDIQQTKDGILVLMHDRNLRRTTGINKEVASLPIEEIKKLDAGAWFGSDFIHTPIPTLEEAMQLCRGRIRLNIEVKPYRRSQGLEEALVSLIEQSDFEHHCLVSSTDYKVLKRVKDLNPNIKTGLILTALYGDYYGTEFIDYYSIRSPYITKSIVDSAHRLGKEVHAWTVNKITELERMKSLGVDSIITDNPILTREILYQDDTTESFISLLNRMLQHHSFYQLTKN